MQYTGSENTDRKTNFTTGSQHIIFHSYSDGKLNEIKYDTLLIPFRHTRNRDTNYKTIYEIDSALH